jgi:hypothetical protein
MSNPSGVNCHLFASDAKGGWTTGSCKNGCRRQWGTTRHQFVIKTKPFSSCFRDFVPFAFKARSFGQDSGIPAEISDTSYRNRIKSVHTLGLRLRVIHDNRLTARKLAGTSQHLLDSEPQW